MILILQIILTFFFTLQVHAQIGETLSGIDRQKSERDVSQVEEKLKNRMVSKYTQELKDLTFCEELRLTVFLELETSKGHTNEAYSDISRLGYADLDPDSSETYELLDKSFLDDLSDLNLIENIDVRRLRLQIDLQLKTSVRVDAKIKNWIKDRVYEDFGISAVVLVNYPKVDKVSMQSDDSILRSFAKIFVEFSGDGSLK